MRKEQITSSAEAEALELSLQLRRGTSESLSHRRAIVALSLAAMGAMG